LWQRRELEKKNLFRFSFLSFEKTARLDGSSDDEGKKELANRFPSRCRPQFMTWKDPTLKELRVLENKIKIQRDTNADFLGIKDFP
jgi:hypothetical protein